MRMRIFGLTFRHCAVILQVSVRTLYRWTKTAIQSRPLDRTHLRLLSASDVERLHNQLERNPSLTLRDLRGEGPGCVSTIWRAVHRDCGYTFKKSTKSYIESNPVKVKEFKQKIERYPITSLIAIDEAGFFLNHSRVYAWSKKGNRAVVPRPGCRGQRYSLVLATSSDSVVKWEMCPKSVNSTMFSKFLADLPDRSKLILDNAAIHKATKSLSSKGLQTVPEIANRKEMEMLYLPPYTPQNQPVELCFNTIRTFVNRQMPRTEAALRNCVASAIVSLKSESLLKCFQKALRF